MPASKSCVKKLRNELIKKGSVSSTGGKGRLLGKLNLVLNIGIGDVEDVINAAGAKLGDIWKVYLPKD